MQIVEKNIDELTPYERNPRKNDNAVQYVANSIKEFGFKVPIVIDKNGVIVAGHTRLKAAKELGMKTVPCIVADDLTEEQVKAFRLADNKTGEMAGWDFSMLEEELSKIDLDMNLFGFQELDLGTFFDEEPQMTESGESTVGQNENCVFEVEVSKEARDDLVNFLEERGFSYKEK